MADPRLTGAWFRAWLFGGWFGILAACSAAQPAPQEPPTQLERPATAGTLPDSGWVRVQARSMAVSLLLPDAQRWRAAPRDSWWSIAHEPTHSVLELKRWRADGLVRPDDCEADAMLWRPELRDAGKPVVEERRFMTEAEVEFALRVHAEAGHDGSTRGRVHAHGASLRECLSFVFTTRAVGGHAPAIVAERLQLVADHVVPSLMPLRVEQRVERIRRQ